MSLWWTFPASSGPRLVRRRMVSLRHTHTRGGRQPCRLVPCHPRGVPGNYTTGWITCRSIDCRSNACRSIDCRSNDCRINGINGTTPNNSSKEVLKNIFKISLPSESYVTFFIFVDKRDNCLVPDFFFCFK